MQIFRRNFHRFLIFCKIEFSRICLLLLLSISNCVGGKSSLSHDCDSKINSPLPLFSSTPKSPLFTMLLISALLDHEPRNNNHWCQVHYLLFNINIVMISVITNIAIILVIIIIALIIVKSSSSTSTWWCSSSITISARLHCFGCHHWAPVYVPLHPVSA